MDTQKELLQVESLTKTYGRGENKTEALKGISFRVPVSYTHLTLPTKRT